MVTVVRMPQLGLTMEKGTMGKWIKAEGDRISLNEPLCEILTDKADAQVESPGAGLLRRILLAEGDDAAIGEAIGIVAEADEEIGSVLYGEGSSGACIGETVSAPGGQDRASTVPSPRERIIASPVARRLATEMGVDLASVSPTGPGGRITREDVLAFADSSVQPSSPVPADAVVQLSRVELVAARRLSASFRDIPQINVMIDVDGSGLDQARNQWKDRGTDCSYNDLIIKIVADLLREFPRLNAWFEADRLTSKGQINIAVAVDTAEGLMVPVVRDADRRTVPQIAVETVRLAEAARAGRLTLDEMSSGTFTISNLGMFGVRLFTAIVNPPQVALLAVAALEPRVVANRDGSIMVRRMMTINLVCDHRAIDGSMAARFLKQCKERLESL